ncbi:MAG: ATP synthase A1 subunit C, partial [Thermoplasmata archaeon]
MEIPERARFIAESTYGTEVHELASKYSGIDLVEYALNLNLARTYHSIIEFSTGDLKKMLSMYLERWDVFNIKTILRAKSYEERFGEAKEDVHERALATLVPAGVFDLSFLVSVLNAATIDESIEKLEGTWFYQPLLETKEKIKELKRVAPFEEVLYKVYYKYLLSAIPENTKPNKLFLDFVRKEIDITNLSTLFRCFYEGGLNTGELAQLMIPGGLELDIEKLKNLATIEGLDGLENALVKYSFYADIKESFGLIEKEHSVNPVVRELERHLLKSADTFSHIYPLSILPIISYILRKKVEVDNIRIIARGKESGLEDEVIQRQLMMV